MKKLDLRSYHTVIPYITEDPCGMIYPLSVVQMYQHGDIYTDGHSVLIWHQCGFAYIFGHPDHSFFDEIHDIMCADDLPRRFILFTADPDTERYFHGKQGIVTGQRYGYRYPSDISASSFPLPDGYEIHEIDRDCIDRMQGRITPYFSWREPSEFLVKGKGFYVTYEDIPAAWAFSAAVTDDEIDIGIETHTDHRHKGLALAAASHMIRYCMDMHKRPVWACDAANGASQALAEKLGFVRTGTYTTIRRC